MLRHAQPQRVVEVGTGWSTCAMLDVDDLFLDGNLAITSIDPDPSRLRARMRPGDEQRVRILEQPVQAVALETFEALAAHDVLFVDSTHVLKTGSDVNHLLFEVLPRLAPGVLGARARRRLPVRVPARVGRQKAARGTRPTPGAPSSRTTRPSRSR